MCAIVYGIHERGENSLLWHLLRANPHVLAGHVFALLMLIPLGLIKSSNAIMREKLRIFYFLVGL